jgi:hypothetical protein
MFKRIAGNKGVALYMVIASIMIALVFAGIMLNLLLSQSRFSLHSSSRLQAYYAALAGANYAFEMFRTATWSETGPYANHGICQAITATPPADCTVCDIAEPNLPGTIACVNIVVDGSTGPQGTLRIRSTAVYTAPS